MCVFLQAKMRNRTAGLGLKGSDVGATAGDSERDILKKMVRMRCDCYGVYLLLNYYWLFS
jgi:hypothetical protein